MRPAIYRLAVGANCGAHLPILHLRHGFFFQPETRPFQNLWVEYAAISGNRHVEQHGSLILRLTRFVGVFRLRTVDTGWGTDAVHAGAEHAAARASAFAWPKSAAGAAADAASFTCADTTATAWATGIIHGCRQRIAHVSQRRVGHLEMGRTERRRIHRQVGIQVLERRFRRSELRVLEFRSATLRRRQLRTVTAPATATGLVGARRQLRDIRGNVQRRDVDPFVLCLGGNRQDIPEDRDEQQQDHATVQTKCDGLAPAEVFILRPDILHLHRLYGEGQGRLLRWREKFLEAGAEAAQNRSPGYCQSAVHRSLRCRAGAEKILQVIADAGTEGCLCERRILALADLDGALRQELLQVGPKIVGDENIGLSEFWHSRRWYWNRGLRACGRHFGPCNFSWPKID